MNIFEENQKKYQINGRGSLAMMGLMLLLAGGVVFTIGLPLSFIIIGIPFVIGGLIAMAIGLLMLVVAPFYKKKKK